MQSSISKYYFTCKSAFFINFQSLKTLGKSSEVLEKSLNFTQTCQYEPCSIVSIDIQAGQNSKSFNTIYSS